MFSFYELRCQKRLRIQYGCHFGPHLVSNLQKKQCFSNLCIKSSGIHIGRSCLPNFRTLAHVDVVLSGRNIETVFGYSKTIRNLYSKFIFEVHIRCLYSKFIFEVYIQSLYSKFIFEVYIRRLYSKV